MFEIVPAPGWRIVKSTPRGGVIFRPDDGRWSPSSSPPVSRRAARFRERRQRLDFRPLAAYFYRDLRSDRPCLPNVERFVGELGVSIGSLDRVGCGWFVPAKAAAWPDCEAATAVRQWIDEKEISTNCWSFPMQDVGGRVVGVRLRPRRGRKFSLPRTDGSALFLPDHLSGNGPLLLPEGETDTMAALDLGYDAIGRPNRNVGLPYLRGYCRERDVVVVSDADDPGRAGAQTIARGLFARCNSVRVVEPPSPFKDLRAWRKAGASTEDVADLIAQADELDSRFIRGAA